MPEEGDDDGGVTTVLWALLWLIGLLSIGWWIGLLFAFLHVVIQPFSACIPQLEELSNVFLHGQDIPLHFARFMIDGTPLSKVSLNIVEE